MYSNEGTDSGSSDISAVTPKRRPFPSFLPRLPFLLPHISLRLSPVLPLSAQPLSVSLSLPPSPSLSLLAGLEKMNEYN